MIKHLFFLNDFQSKIGKSIAKIPISPNQWTFFSLLIAICGAFMITLNSLLAGLVLFALSFVFDAIDGAVARARNETSNFGGFLDGVIDRFVEAIFLFSFMFYPLPSFFFDSKIWIAFVLFFGTSMVSFVRAYADHKGVIQKEKTLKMGGVCERTERLLLLTIGLFAGIFISMNYFVYSLVLATLLSIVTIIERIWFIFSNKT